jgi:hypothetical protein
VTKAKFLFWSRCIYSVVIRRYFKPEYGGDVQVRWPEYVVSRAHAHVYCTWLLSLISVVIRRYFILVHVTSVFFFPSTLQHSGIIH